MRIQNLNEDILDNVFAHLSSRDARKHCSVTRMFYAIARRHAIRDVNTSGFRQTVKFCDWMIHDSPDLLPCLWSLRFEFHYATTAESYKVEIDEEEEYESGASRIAELLQRVSNLRVLALHEAELLMAYEPRIATIIASLHRLQELELHDIGSRVLDALHCLQSTPDKMVLAGYTQWQSFASAFIPRRWSVAPMNIYFPSVHALSLQDRRHFPGTDQLASVVPNVVQLEVAVHPLQAMEHFQPVAVTVTMPPGYGHLRMLFAHDRNPRLRYVTTGDFYLPKLGLYDWLPQLQGMWGLLQTSLNRRRDVICVKVHHPMAHTPYGAYIAEGGQLIPFASRKHILNSVLTAFPRWATKLVSLRYLSLDLRTGPRRLASCLSTQWKEPQPEEASDENVFWWEFDRGGEVPQVKQLSALRGEQIADFLCSARYDWRLDLDAQSY